MHTCGVIADVALNESVAITVKLNFTKEDSVTLSVHIDPSWSSVYGNSPSIVTVIVSPGSVIRSLYNAVSPTVIIKVSLASMTGGVFVTVEYKINYTLLRSMYFASILNCIDQCIELACNNYNNDQGIEYRGTKIVLQWLQTIPSPVYPLGQGGQVTPVPGAGTSVHLSPPKHDTSVQPSKSSSQYFPSYAFEWIGRQYKLTCQKYVHAS